MFMSNCYYTVNKHILKAMQPLKIISYDWNSKLIRKHAYLDFLAKDRYIWFTHDSTNVYKGHFIIWTSRKNPDFQRLYANNKGAYQPAHAQSDQRSC